MNICNVMLCIHTDVDHSDTICLTPVTTPISPTHSNTPLFPASTQPQNSPSQLQRALSKKGPPPPPHPSSKPDISPPQHLNGTQPPLPSVDSSPSPPRPTSAHSNSNNPFLRSTSSKPPLTATSASASASALSSNSDEASLPDTSSLTPDALGLKSPISRASSSPAPIGSSNPFLNRTKANTIAGGGSTTPTPITASPSSVASVPPLPPRKPSFLPPPPRHHTQQPTPTSLPPSPLPPLPRKPGAPPTHPSTIAGTTTISPLIKQSLLAAKGAQKNSEMNLDKLRTWEVIKSSATSSTSTSTSTSSPTPGGGGGLVRSLSPSTSGSATTTTGVMPKIRSTTAVSPNSRISPSTNGNLGANTVVLSSSSSDRDLDLDWSPGIGAGPSGGTRVGRSKSLHHPSSPTVARLDGAGSEGGGRYQPQHQHQHSSSTISALPPPPPPPSRKKKRPESVQGLLGIGSGAESGGRRGSGSSSAGVGAGSGIGGVKNAVAAFQSQMEDMMHHHHHPHSDTRRLESARAKFEGRVIPTGFNKWREERLVTHSGDDVVGASSEEEREIGDVMRDVRGRRSMSGGGARVVRSGGSGGEEGGVGGGGGGVEFEGGESTEEDLARLRRSGEGGWRPLKG